jgi:hypothetical protein
VAEGDGSQLKAAKIAAMATVAAALISALAVLVPKLVDNGGDHSSANPGPTATPTIQFPTVNGSSEATPSVFLNRTSGAGGSTLLVSGKGFEPGEEVVIRFHTDEIGRTTANSEGRFENVAVTVPTSFSKFAPQQFQVSATGRSSLRADETPFEITG